VQRACEVFDLCEAMIEKGNPNSVTDAGVGVLCAKAAVTGAYLNVRINAAGLEDKAFAAEIVTKAKDYVEKAVAREAELLKRVEEVIG
jgi:glutamate formiminotransferase/formiminotetrahydrofolate cyclodeaminase